MELVTKIAFWCALLVTIGAIADIFYKLSKGEIKDIGKKIPFYVVMFAILFLVIRIDVNRKTKQETSCSDNYLSISIPSKFEGPFYNPEKYNLSLEVKNNQDKTILLSSIIAYFKNQDVFNNVEALRLLSEREGFSTTTYFTSIYENPGVLVPRNSKTFNLRGPDFLPQEVELVVSHSNSIKQTICNFTVSFYDNVEYPFPKHVNVTEKGLGVDVLPYIKNAKPKNTKLLSIIPGKSKTLIQESGLFFHDITEWMLTFINNQNKGSLVLVGTYGTKQAGDYDTIAIPNIPNFDRLIDVEQIKFGPKEALMVANKSDSIYGNSPHGWALLVGWDNKKKVVPIWRLPYIGKDYLNIFVNAENGEILPSIWFFDKYAPISTGSRTTFKKDDE